MCIFCEIVKGNVPCFKIYEDERALAFLDIAQETYGHTVVITKKHYKDITQTPNNELKYLIAIVKKISKHYIEGDFGYDGVNILNNCRESDGHVDHVHFHILPRKVNDKGEFAITPKNIQKANLLEVKQKLTML